VDPISALLYTVIFLSFKNIIYYSIYLYIEYTDYFADIVDILIFCYAVQTGHCKLILRGPNTYVPQVYCLATVPLLG